MPTEPSFGDSFVVPDLPPHVQKRKAGPDQADDAKKSRGDDSFMDKSLRADWSYSKISSPGGNNSEASFNV